MGTVSLAEAIMVWDDGYYLSGFSDMGGVDGGLVLFLVVWDADFICIGQSIVFGYLVDGRCVLDDGHVSIVVVDVGRVDSQFLEVMVLIVIDSMNRWDEDLVVFVWWAWVYW